MKVLDSAVNTNMRRSDGRVLLVSLVDAGGAVCFEGEFRDPVRAMTQFSRVAAEMLAGEHDSRVGAYLALVDSALECDAGYVCEGMGSFKKQYGSPSGEHLFDVVAAADLASEALPSIAKCLRQATAVGRECLFAINRGEAFPSYDQYMSSRSELEKEGVRREALELEGGVPTTGPTSLQKLQHAVSELEAGAPGSHMFLSGEAMLCFRDFVSADFARRVFACNPEDDGAAFGSECAQLNLSRAVGRLVSDVFFEERLVVCLKRDPVRYLSAMAPSELTLADSMISRWRQGLAGGCLVTQAVAGAIDEKGLELAHEWVEQALDEHRGTQWGLVTPDRQIGRLCRSYLDDCAQAVDDGAGVAALVQLEANFVRAFCAWASDRVGVGLPVAPCVTRVRNALESGQLFSAEDISTIAGWSGAARGEARPPFVVEVERTIAKSIEAMEFDLTNCEYAIAVRDKTVKPEYKGSWMITDPRDGDEGYAIFGDDRAELIAEAHGHIFMLGVPEAVNQAYANALASNLAVSNIALSKSPMKEHHKSDDGPLGP